MQKKFTPQQLWRYLVLQFVAMLFVLIACFMYCGAVQAQSGKKPTSCASDLDSCPIRGCATAGTSDALTNQLKRTWPTAQTAVLLTLDDFESLQEQSDKLVGQKVALTKVTRKKLSNLDSAGGKVSEGDLVAVTGFLVGVPHANKKESVNCGLLKPPNNDFHITIARDPDDTEFDGIVVEMIPQKRPKEWTISVLKKIEKDGRMVLVRGQLLYDNKHVVNDDQDNSIGGQPKRFSLWELHPITEFFACEKDKKCDPKDLSQWELIGKVTN